MFELDAGRKSVGPMRALGPIDLRIERGRTTVLIGPSGCGKSTALRLMVGLVTPDAGTVSFDGTPVTSATIGALRRRLGYVIQEGGLFPHLTAAANAALMARHLGWPSERIDARLSELAALTRLPPALLAHYPAQLSGGQRQRVS